MPRFMTLYRDTWWDIRVSEHCKWCVHHRLREWWVLCAQPTADENVWTIDYRNVGCSMHFQLPVSAMCIINRRNNKSRYVTHHNSCKIIWIHVAITRHTWWLLFISCILIHMLTWYVTCCILDVSYVLWLLLPHIVSDFMKSSIAVTTLNSHQQTLSPSLVHLTNANLSRAPEGAWLSQPR